MQETVGMSSVQDIALRGRVAALVKLKYSASMIAKETGINKKTAERLKKECKENEQRFLEGRHYSHDGHSPYSPREQKTAVSAFIHMQPIGSRSATPKIRQKPGAPPSVAARTVRRWTRRDGFHPYVQPRRPQLSKAHKRQRYQFALNNRETEFALWNFNDQFRVSFPLKGTKKKPFWAPPRDSVKPKPGKKFPEILQVHASLTIHGPLPLITYDGSMNSEKFREVNDELIPLLTDMFDGAEFCYQHDQAPWFTSGATQTYFEQETPSSVHVVSPTEFPPNSPDINLAETAMAIVLGRVFDRKPKHKEELEAFLKEEWLKLSKEEIENMYRDLPAILKLIRKKKGGNTNR